MENHQVVFHLQIRNGQTTGRIVSSEEGVFPWKDHEHTVWRASVERAAFAAENDFGGSQKDPKELQTQKTNHEEDIVSEKIIKISRDGSQFDWARNKL